MNYRDSTRLKLRQVEEGESGGSFPDATFDASGTRPSATATQQMETGIRDIDKTTEKTRLIPENWNQSPHSGPVLGFPMDQLLTTNQGVSSSDTKNDVRYQQGASKKLPGFLHDQLMADQEEDDYDDDALMSGSITRSDTMRNFDDQHGSKSKLILPTEDSGMEWKQWFTQPPIPVHFHSALFDPPPIPSSYQPKPPKPIGLKTQDPIIAKKPDTIDVVVPRVEKSIAVNALESFLPYPHDIAKQGRYRRFLEFCADQCSETEFKNIYTSDRALLGRESQEFAKAAVIFKPMSSAFASRFTSSTSQPANIVETALASGGGLQTIEEMQAKKLLAETVAPKPVQKQPEDDKPEVDPHEIRRTVVPWAPSNDLCKRFNISPPDTTKAEMQGRSVATVVVPGATMTTDTKTSSESATAVIPVEGTFFSEQHVLALVPELSARCASLRVQKKPPGPPIEEFRAIYDDELQPTHKPDAKPSKEEPPKPTQKRHKDTTDNDEIDEEHGETKRSRSRDRERRRDRKHRRSRSSSRKRKRSRSKDKTQRRHRSRSRNRSRSRHRHHHNEDKEYSRRSSHRSRSRQRYQEGHDSRRSSHSKQHRSRSRHRYQDEENRDRRYRSRSRDGSKKHARSDRRDRSPSRSRPSHKRDHHDRTHDD